MKKLILLIAIITCWAISAAAEEPFHGISFEAACVAAKKDNKIVMIDFYAVWCGPCKLLDKNTWQNQQVRDWLKEKTIALKIDAEKETALAQKYNVHAYPTILLINADGSEIDRLVGYRAPEEFLADANDAISGKDSLTRAKESLAGENQNNPLAHLQYADLLAQKGRNQEALTEYLWCFDHGNEFDQGFYGVRSSSLLTAILRLGFSYPPAIDALRERRDSAEKLLLSNKGTIEKAVDFANLNRYLSDSGRTLTLFDQLKKQGDGATEIKNVLIEYIIDQLLVAKRYADIVDNSSSLPAKVGLNIKRYQQTIEMLNDRPNLDKARTDQVLAYLKSRLITEASKYYQALLGVGKTAEADQIADQLTKFDATGNTYAILIQYAVGVGANQTAHNLAERGLKSLPEAEQKLVKQAIGLLPQD